MTTKPGTNTSVKTMTKFEIVRLTHESGRTDYAVRKTRLHWLTRKPEHFYLEDCYDHWDWTRNPNRAETWPSAIGADRVLARIKGVEGQKVLKVEVV